MLTLAVEFLFTFIEIYGTYFLIFSRFYNDLLLSIDYEKLAENLDNLNENLFIIIINIYIYYKFAK